jgi:uncharacterized protein YbjQ (UPF0145 family)
MDDIVYERVSHPDECTCLICLMGQEIEQLRAEIAAMRRQALQNMINESENAGLYQQP